MIKNLLLLIAGCFIFNLVAAQIYHISANITGFKNGTKVDLADDDEKHFGSATISNNAFKLNGNLKNGPQYLNITIHNASQDYDLTLFADGNVAVSGDKKDFPHNIKVTGGKEQAAYNDYQNALKPFLINTDKQLQVYKAASNAADKDKAGKAYTKSVRASQNFMAQWVLKHPDNYYAANEMYMAVSELGRSAVARSYTAFSAPVKQSIYGKRINTYLTVGNALKIGDHYSDFEAGDPSGKKQKLSALARGGFILLDFSSVYCGPCNKSIPELSKLSKKYKEKLAVVTFSADKPDVWLKGFKQDHITWASLNDGKEYYSTTMLKYGVQAIPVFVLIAPNGIIIDKWDGYETLEKGPGDIERHILKHIKK